MNIGIDKRFLPQLAFLTLFTCFCVALVGVRVVWTGKGTYLFMVWNLFLAWLPLAFSLGAQWTERRGASLLATAAWFIPWLLFLPNAPYILTDLVHLRPRPGVPYWYDIVMLASFAFHGVILGFQSMLHMHGILQRYIRPLYGWAAMGIFSVGAAYGIYLGRVLRWNSWDILRHPLRIVADCLAPFMHPWAHKQAIAMTVLLAAFLFGGYLVARASAGVRAHDA